MEDLKETILSFKRQDYPNCKIAVSDNGSTDNSTQWLKTAYPDIKVLENNKNLGWSGGNNVGIKYALQRQAKYILLANNDLSIDNTRVISNLVCDLERFKEFKISIIGPGVNYYYDKKLNHNTGWIIYPKGEQRGYFFNEFRKNNSLKLESNYKFVDAADGCFFMVDSNIFRRIGLFKEELFMYADEIDFSFRAWAHGYKSVVNTSLTIYHKIGTSSVPNSPFSTYYRNRNLLLLIKCNGKRLRYFLLFSKDVLKAIIRNILRSRITLRQKIEIQNAIISGVIDGILNRFGKRF